MVLREPDPRFRGFISGEYQGWTEISSESVRRREVPICAIPFIINFGAAFRQIDPIRQADGHRTLGTFVAGMYDSFIIIESQGRSSCIQVNFTPIGARLFFQLPLSELANRSLGLDELYGDQARAITLAIAEAGNWDRRFDLLDALVAQRITQAARPRPEIREAWRRMQETPGKVEIGKLAQELGWSHKHLIAQFRDHLGAPPKQIERVLRLQRAIQRLGERRPPRWAAIALESGYFDQSHMIREFHALAGCTPEEYVSLQLAHGGVSADSRRDFDNSALG
jgi:AraC-like DNA-binding protein